MDNTNSVNPSAVLMEPAERLRLIEENVRDYAIFTLDREGRIASWNIGAERILGFSEAEIFGQLGEIIFTPEDRAEGIPEKEQETARKDGRAEDERWHIRNDGSRFYASGVLTLLRNQEGQIYGFAKILRDMTKRVRVEESLRASEERYRLTVENVRDYALFALDPEGHITSWNEGARRVKGYQAEEVIGQHFRLFYTEEDRQAGKPEQELENAARTGRNEDESWRVRKDGSLFWINEIITAIRDDKGTLFGFVKISRDLTERKRAEEKRIGLEHEATLLAERNRMAQELHDTLAQSFTGIKLQTEITEELLPIEAEEAKKHVIRTREIAMQAMREARTAILALRLPLLQQGSLSEALEQLVEQADQGVKVSFQQEGTFFSLPVEVEEDLYRIAQESLTNALRHANAQQIYLRLAYSQTQVSLMIKDDGRGFDPQVNYRGFGLRGIHERTERIGATLTVTSQPGQGTEITVRLPRSEESSS